MLIGAVGGLALVKGLEASGVPLDLGMDVTLTPIAGNGVARLVATGLPLIILSALLATVPDIDEPGSFIARRTRVVVTLACGGLAGLAASAGRLPIALWAGAAGIGLLVGWVIGYVLLRVIRRAAGGHRRFTHSLVLAGLLAALAFGLWQASLGAWAIIPAGLAWGIVLHDLGDIVTTSGVPLMYPFSDQAVRVLPEPICRMGELLAGATACLVGGVLVGVIRF